MTKENKFEENRVYQYFVGVSCELHPETLIKVISNDGTVREGRVIDINWEGATEFWIVKHYRKPREIWVNVYPNNFVGGSWNSKKEAERFAGPDAIEIAVHYVEKLK